MDQSPSLRRDYVILNLQSVNRFSAYKEMIGKAAFLGDLSDEAKETFLGQLIEREEQSTFAMGKGIAIPHINGANIDKCIFLYGRSTEGIEFGSCDAGLVHHIFLALIPETQKCGWLKSLASLAKTLSDASLREQLMVSTSPSAVHLLLQNQLSQCTSVRTQVLTQ